MSTRCPVGPSFGSLLLAALTLALGALSTGCGSGGGEEGSSDPAGVSGTSRYDMDELDAFVSVSVRPSGEVVVGASVQRDTTFDVFDLEVGGSDAFRATVGGRSRTLLRSEEDEDPYYFATFTKNPPEGDVDVRFRDATFRIPLRPGFEVVSPAPGSVFGFQDDLELEWSPADSSSVIQIWISRECTTLTGGKRGGSFYLQVRDDGAHTYDLGSLPEATDPAIDTAQDCSLSLRFVRSAETNIAPPFELGSRMTSVQSRSVDGLILTF